MDYVHGQSIIKIALAEDSELLQDLLPGFIDGMENCKVVIQAYNGRELLEKLSTKPDTSLVIMDIKMPEIDGIEAAK
jgi:YesN/AraC family two-component response regulator